MPFEAKLDEDNRWVILSKIVPWEEFARLYYKNFKSNRGATTKDARLVLGVIIIKHIMKTDDRGVIEIPGESLHACVTRMQLHIEWLKYESCVRNCQRDGSRPPATGIQV